MTKSIDVVVPITTAYDQWTRFESFPYFMADVESVTPLDAIRSHWVTTIGGVIREFDTVIVEQQPYERVAWTSTESADQAGVVTFQRMSNTETRVTVRLDWPGRGAAESAEASAGLDDDQVGADLRRFKDYIENRRNGNGNGSGDGDESWCPDAVVPRL